MVLLVTTPTILSALETLSPSSRDELHLPHSPALGSPISHAQVIALARYFTSGRGNTVHNRGNENTEGAGLSGEEKNEGQDGVSSDHSSTAPTSVTPLYTLNSLLRGTSVYIPPPPPKPEPVRPKDSWLALFLTSRQTSFGLTKYTPEPRICRPKSTSSGCR